jgi:gliding motility-associated lipoprotein GldJ
MRTNYTDSDQRNFRDGDKSSSRYYRSYQEAEDESQRMYNSPTYNVAGAKDSTGVAQRGYDTADRTTLISDEVRVYKGGSWRDRAYWLDPAQRRYFPQDMATDYIGFRNAMSRVGSKSLDNNKKARN